MSKISKKLLVFTLILSMICGFLPHSSFIAYAQERTAVVKATGVNVRSGAGTSNKQLGQVNAGDRLTVIGESKDTQNKIWYKFNYNGKTAFIREDFVYFPKTYTYDERFEANLMQQGFPETYKEYLRLLHAEYPNWSFEAFNTNIDFEYAVDMENQPGMSLVAAGSISSYKSDDEDKYDYVNSKWIPMDGADWVSASKNLIRYYMDPRNFLLEPYVFQFEKQTFDSAFQSLDGVKEMVKGSFLDDTITTTGYDDKVIAGVATGKTPSTMGSTVTNAQGPGSAIYDTPNPGIGSSSSDEPVIPILMNDNNILGFTNTIYSPSINNEVALSPPMFTNIDMENQSFYFNYEPAGEHTYAEIIYNACAQVGINPYVVVAMILQEVGKDGVSTSISGKNKKYPGIYNYCNAGAYAGNGNTAAENGLLYASKEGAFNRPWNTKEKGIYGAVDYYANSFIRKGQDTFYLKKWNVQGKEPYKHQYMTNVLGAAREGQILSQAYDDTLKASKHNFKIPIYKNMPEERCVKPSTDGNPNNKLKTLNITGFTLNPAFDRSIYEYTCLINEDTTSVNVDCLRYTAKTDIVGKGKVNIVEPVTRHVITLTAENKSVREYVIYFYKPSAGGIIDTVKNMGVASTPAINQNTGVVSTPIVNQNAGVGYIPGPPVGNVINQSANAIISPIS